MGEPKHEQVYSTGLDEVEFSFPEGMKAEHYLTVTLTIEGENGSRSFSICLPGLKDIPTGVLDPKNEFHKTVIETALQFHHQAEAARNSLDQNLIHKFANSREVSRALTSVAANLVF